ncbi:radical SAM protein [bacterium]|nr:radical SAM protein [bacterium]
MIQLMTRMTREIHPKLLWKFAYNGGFKSMRAVQKFNKRLAKGQNIPAFYFLSITSACNLSCQGCWVSPNPKRELDIEHIHKLINEAKSYGTYFFGILGGEPLLYPHLYEILEQHPDCYFILFTNGTLITDDVAARLHRAGNVSPLISIEGNDLVSDERRGGTNVHSRTYEGLEACRRQHLPIGVASSICKSNIDDLATDEFLQKLANNGVHYMFYYIYRPVGPMPAPELALSKEEIVQFRQFLVDARTKSPVMIIDAYWDQDGKALCPAATGIMHHIGPGGHIEPCPPVQFAAAQLNGQPLVDTLSNCNFLHEFKKQVPNATRGCILMDNPKLLADIISKTGAADTSGRNTAMEELLNMTPCASHSMPGQEIPEKAWAYKFAKKHWFFGFGAYG